MGIVIKLLSQGCSEDSMRWSLQSSAHMPNTQGTPRTLDHMLVVDSCFSSSELETIWAGLFFAWRAFLHVGGMFRHIPGLHPLDVSGTSSSRDNKKVSRCYPMPPRRHRNTAVVWCLRAAISYMVATSYLWWLSPWNVANVHALK